MSLVRVHNFSISLDGFGTGEGLSHDAPFGHAGERLHECMFATRFWGEMVSQPGGSGGIDDVLAQHISTGIGVEIMGAHKFGYPGWARIRNGRAGGVPTRRSTHRSSSSPITRARRIKMEGGTTFHFIDASPAEALETAREAAGGQDVRLGGGPTVIREDFLVLGLIDRMHIVVVPILLGRGVRLWDELEGPLKGPEVEATSSPGGVTHVTFTRAGV